MSFKEYNFAVIPVGVIILVLFSVIFLLPAHIGEIQEGFRKIERTKKETEELKIKYLLISSLDKETLERQASLAVAALPETKNVPYILQGLRDSILKAGFAVKEMKFSPGEIEKEDLSGRPPEKLEEKQVEKLPIEMKVAGSFSNLINLLTELESTAPIFEVDSFDFVATEREGGNSSMEIRLNTFYSPPMAVYESQVVTLESLVLSEEETAFLEKLSAFNLPIVEARRGTESMPSTRVNPFSL